MDTGAIMTMTSSAGISVFGNMTILQGGILNNDGVLDLKGNLVNQN
jgi:hypothetical protein